MKLGIDIGGTNISLGLVNDGALCGIAKVPSFKAEFIQKETFDYLEENIRRIITPEVDGIGIGVPSVVDVKTGVVYDAANIPSWDEAHLKEEMERRLGIPVFVNNDSNCYALGAYWAYEGTPRPESLVAITLGTGLGMGIVLDGKLFCGSNCGAGELGCIPYEGKTVEDYCSKKFFLDRDCTPKGAADAARGGDAAARELFLQYGRHLGYAVSVALYAYDPDVIVLGGGLSHNFDVFKPIMDAYLKENFPYGKILDKLKVCAMPSDDLPVLGAASLAY